MISPPYPWEEWADQAEEDGIAEELVALGCRTIRQAYVHRWTGHAYDLCVGAGIANMTLLAQRAPKLAERIWTLLLQTEGLRTFNDEDTGEMVDLIVSRETYEGEAYA